MIIIRITGELTGKRALMYEFRKRKGRRAFVPTYKAYASNLFTGEYFEFAVTRQSSKHVFSGVFEDRYAEGGECPPNAETPYMGVVREDGDVGFRIQLHEKGYEADESVKGQGPIPRKFVQIHFGAAASGGCFMVAGRRREYRQRFVRPLQEMLEHTEEIRVIVQPYAA